MTLAGFLLARIAEDEALARECEVAGREAPWGRECDAKRRIIGLHGPVPFTDRDLGFDNVTVCWTCHGRLMPPDNGDTPEDEWPDDEGWTYPIVQDPYPCYTLRLLAQPYAGHPDFDPEWAVSDTPTAPEVASSPKI